MFPSRMFLRTGASPMVVVLGGNNDCRLAAPYFWRNYVNSLQTDTSLQNFYDLNRIAYNFFSAELLESVTTFWPNSILKL